MDTLLSIVQGVLNLGASVILPIMIFLLGLFFRMKPGAAIKAGLLVGIGFQGLGLVVGLLNTALQPAADYYSAMGSGFTITDVGWPAVGAASWAAPFAALAVPIGVALNLLLIRLRAVKVMNVDIWNYIHFLIPGAMAYALFGSFWLGLLLTVAFSVATLFLSQIVAKRWQDYFGLEGTTCSTFTFLVFQYPISWLVNKLIDFIPGLNKLDISMSKVSQKLGILGDPMIIGLFVGVLLGVLTKNPYGTVISMGMGISAVMVLMPRMVGLLMEGLSPISTAAKEYMQKRMGDDADLLVGMDVALGLGDSCAITTTVISIPLVILLAFIIPGISFFPVGLLMSVCYTAVFASMMSNGNLLRSVISTVVCFAINIFFSNMFAPEATMMMVTMGIPVTGLVTDGFFGQWPAVIIGLFFRMFGS